MRPTKAAELTLANMQGLAFSRPDGFDEAKTIAESLGFSLLGSDEDADEGETLCRSSGQWEVELDPANEHCATVSDLMQAQLDNGDDMIVVSGPQGTITFDISEPGPTKYWE